MQKLVHEEESRPDWNWIRSMTLTGQDGYGRIMVFGAGDLTELNSISVRIVCRALK